MHRWHGRCRTCPSVVSVPGRIPLPMRECDQIFMLVRVLYEVPEDAPPQVDADMNDVFDYGLLEKGNEVWNSGGMVMWPTGYDALHGTMYGGVPRDELNSQ